MFDPTQPTPDTPVTSLIMEAPDDVSGTTVESALVVDQWVDVVPHRALRGDGDTATIDERIVSGLAVNDTSAMLAGAVPAAVLALVVQGVFEWVERRLVRV